MGIYKESVEKAEGIVERNGTVIAVPLLLAMIEDLAKHAEGLEETVQKESDSNGWKRGAGRTTVSSFTVESKSEQGTGGWLIVENDGSNFWNWRAFHPDEMRTADGSSPSEMRAYHDAVTVFRSWGFEVELPSWVKPLDTKSMMEDDDEE